MSDYDEESKDNLIEIRVKMYVCKICGIRYDSVNSMRQHYSDEHSKIDPIDENSKVKEEVMDEEEIENEEATGGYVLIDENGQQIELPEGIQITDSQIVQLADNQIVFEVINPDADENESEDVEETVSDEASPIIERRLTRAQKAAEIRNADKDSSASKYTPGKRGRKRKNAVTEEIKSKLPSSRPKRVIVPNIKSEFVYDSLEKPIENVKQSYRIVQEDGVFTAYQMPDGEDKSPVKKNKSRTQSKNADEEDDLSYPPEYTPTSKAKKGRITEPKEDDSHLRRFPCPFQGCKYVAKYRSNLWDHKKTHTGEKPYACNWPSCTMRFSQTHQLKLHLRSHTGERPYVCDWPGCNSAFSQKPGLKSHMLTHTGEKPFKCDFPGCNWTFRLKGALTDHKRAIHENAKKHICEWPGCNKRFLQQCHLKKHIMGHADIKPFACDWPNCNYRAVTAAYVTNHRKTHTGEKNYECTYPNCNKRFVKSSHVNRHRQRCHPELFLGIDLGDDYIIQSDGDVKPKVT
ncbi:Zinc finger protein [Sarcoptes scabiei]|uniref:Zinc finger protein n=2 Tax=Sarcoptes scabiei TaxID=52283 RepID=A0A834RCM7_SARSC|nr:Zinc finger protein [Sarcoptes scabiei]